MRGKSPLVNGLFDSLSAITETDMKARAHITACLCPFYLKRSEIASTWALWNLFTSAVNWLRLPDWFHQCWFVLLQAGSGYVHLMDRSGQDPAPKRSPVHLSRGGVCPFTAATVWSKYVFYMHTGTSPWLQRLPIILPFFSFWPARTYVYCKFWAM